MTIKISEINDRCQFLFYYHAGSGGEFIASTFAENHQECVPLPYIKSDRNQFHAISPIMYSAQWPNRNIPDTWVNPHFPHSDDAAQYFVIKDHPNDWNLDCYYSEMPNLTTIYLYAEQEREHFSKLVYAKIGKKIVTPITSEFIRSEVNDLLTNEQEQSIIDWSARYEWIWEHEAMIANTRIADGVGLQELVHIDSLDKYIAEHAALDKVYYDNAMNGPLRNMVFVCIDDLARGDSYNFWHDVAKKTNTTEHMDLDKCIEKTNQWILDNLRLLTNGK